jgi:hypothetical protein
LMMAGEGSVACRGRVTETTTPHRTRTGHAARRVNEPVPCGANGRRDQTTRTASACGPRSPRTTSNSTRWFS